MNGLGRLSSNLYQEIERVEIVCSAYLMISLQSDIFKLLSPDSAISKSSPLEAKLKQHQWWIKGRVEMCLTIYI